MVHDRKFYLVGDKSTSCHSDMALAETGKVICLSPQATLYQSRAGVI